MAGWSRQRAWALVLAALCIAVGFAAVWADAFLVVNAPLEHADAIVIPLGGLPYRAMAAGEIYRAGYARRIIVSRPATEDPRLALFRRFGMDRMEDDQIAARILAKYGVPPSSVLVSVTDDLGTRPELRAVARLLRREHLRSIILVTDPLHTRRASLYMSALGGNRLRVISRVSGQPFDSRQWWWTAPEAEAVLHEYLGLAAFVWYRATGRLKVESP